MAVSQQPRGTGRPGAMTMAMQAVKTVQGPKVLRIGVIQGGKIIEERIIRNRETVSVGTTEKNTFTIVAPNFPARFELFPMSGGTYKLNFIDGMEGRIAMPQGVVSLDNLKQSGQAQRTNVGWQVTLNEQCRGKVTVGDVTFLFQFVAPPPPQPRPQLPAAIRAGWVKNIDWTYNACLSFFLVLAISAVAYVEYIYDPEIEDNFDLSSRVVTLVMPPSVPEPPPEQRQDQNQDSNQQGQQSQQQAQAQQARQERHESAAQRQERQARSAESAARSADRAVDAANRALENLARFQGLTGSLDTGRSAVDTLQNGALMNGSVAALQNTGGIGANQASNGVTLRGRSASAGGPSGNSLGRGGAIQSSGGNINAGGEVVVERRIVARADVGGGSEEGGEGSLDASRVAAVLRRDIGGIRSCYERALRNNPTLSGRLTVRFTIGTSGRATSVSTSGLSSAPEVGSCVASRVRALVFPTPDGGSVDFSFPFNFEPGQ